MLFAEWILYQRHRSDSVGALAGWVAEQPSRPAISTSYRTYVPKEHRQALELALTEWLSTTGQQRAEEEARRFKLRKPEQARMFEGKKKPDKQRQESAKAHNKLITAVIAYVKLRGGHAQKVGVITGWSQAGVPYTSTLAGTADVLGVLKGRALAVECKTGEGRQTQGQKDWQASWERAGGLYVVAHSVEDVEAMLSPKQVEMAR